MNALVDISTPLAVTLTRIAERVGPHCEATDCPAWARWHVEVICPDPDLSQSWAWRCDEHIALGHLAAVQYVQEATP